MSSLWTPNDVLWLHRPCLTENSTEPLYGMRIENNLVYHIPGMSMEGSVVFNMVTPIKKYKFNTYSHYDEQQQQQQNNNNNNNNNNSNYNYNNINYNKNINNNNNNNNKSNSIESHSFTPYPPLLPYHMVLGAITCAVKVCCLHSESSKPTATKYPILELEVRIV